MTNWMRVERNLIINGRKEEPEVYEGEIMSQEAVPQVASLVGDANANVTASSSLSFKDFGNGGEVFVSISLKCNQDENSINWAQYLAKNLAFSYAEQNFVELKERLLKLGIVK